MSAQAIYLLPGQIVLRFACAVVQVPLEQMHPYVFLILSAFVSWLIWSWALRGTWALTKQIFGIQ